MCSGAQGHVCLHSVCTQACLLAHAHGCSSSSRETLVPFRHDTSLRVVETELGCEDRTEEEAGPCLGVDRGWDDPMLLAVSSLCT